MSELIWLPKFGIGAMDEPIRARFETSLRVLEPFLGKPDDFCVAGGFATALACDICKLTPSSFGDIDIFVRSKQGEWAVATWLTTNAHLIAFVRDHGNVLDVVFEEAAKLPRLQFICSSQAKSLPTYDAIVLGFDLDYCCVAVKQDAPEKLLIGMGPATMVALVTRLTRVSAGFAGPLRPSRICKAIDKGFSVDCPEMPRAETMDKGSPYKGSPYKGQGRAHPTRRCTTSVDFSTAILTAFSRAVMSDDS